MLSVRVGPRRSEHAAALAGHADLVLVASRLHPFPISIFRERGASYHRLLLLLFIPCFAVFIGTPDFLGSPPLALACFHQKIGIILWFFINSLSFLELCGSRMVFTETQRAKGFLEFSIRGCSVGVREGVCSTGAILCHFRHDSWTGLTAARSPIHSLIALPTYLRLTHVPINRTSATTRNCMTLGFAGHILKTLAAETRSSAHRWRPHVGNLTCSSVCPDSACLCIASVLIRSWPV